ncbi:MAG: GNAT family N-acetyltransferase [Chloroflexi bacterium]|nr:GNAT family N-acetyltransferase [Chloroflexota bacterium]MBI3341422.1 GNAT family N-acetyltransferase [Chloroflexota bacterium]
MEFTLHTDFSTINPQDWNTLVEAGISDTPFSRYEYLSQWWQTRGGGEWKQAELVLVSASENGRLIGIAPLFKTDYDGRAALLLVGSIEISDYLDLIVRAEDLPRFLTGLFDFLVHSGLQAGTACDWYNLPDSSPTLAALKAESERRGWTYRQEIYRPTPRIALNGSFEEYLARIEKKQRHEIKRKMRRAAEYEMPVRFYIVEDAAALDSEIEAFFSLMIQDPNKALFLKDDMHLQMTSILRAAFEHGYLWLAFLEVGGVKAAAAVNFDYKNKLWGYNSGVNRDFMELSPGWVLLGHQIQWACEHGRTEFDFMRGDEEYKYRLGGVNKFVMRAVIAK